MWLNRKRKNQQLFLYAIQKNGFCNKEKKKSIDIFYRDRF